MTSSEMSESRFGAQQRRRRVALGGQLLLLALHLFLRRDDADAAQLGFSLGLEFLGALQAQCDLAVDLGRLGGQQGFGLLLPQGQVALDFGEAGLTLGVDPGPFGLLPGMLARRLLGGVARRAGFLHPLALGDLGFLLLTLDLQLALQRIELGLTHRDVAIGLDCRPLFPVGGDNFGQLAHADGVEGVVLVQRRQRRLVEPGERGRFEPQAVLLEIFRKQGFDFPDELAPILVELVHGLGGDDRLHGADQPAVEQFVQPVGAERTGADCLGRNRHALRRRQDTQIEFHLHVEAQPVLGHQGGVAGARNLQRHGAHVDLFHPVQEGQDHAAAVHRHFLPAETGPDQCGFPGRLAVESLQEGDENRQRNNNDDNGDEGRHRDRLGNSIAAILTVFRRRSSYPCFIFHVK